ncbi:TonB-dependent siderophore receptor [Aquicoccus sp. SCR17]|nr:TonB-dependent siderophore receptor [Carideicomes alvinocaridis]
MTLRQRAAKRAGGTLLFAMAMAGQAGLAAAQDGSAFEYDDGTIVELDPIIVEAAAEELKQAPGSSVITGEDLETRPVSNDISEAVRRMPGVNLTGNATTGQRGNNRQIDIRGMGPENTLILIDGRPVLSRNSVKMGRSGERDTRGDSNWVPASAIERIEVLRGPAAARYGSGASGGVVNIITKSPDVASTTVTLYGEKPENDKEGATFRTSIVTSGPINDVLSYRGILSYNRTGADAADINAEATPDGESVAAGREGVRNADASLLLEYRPDAVNTWGIELGYSRQGNDYAGDALFQGVDRVDEDLIGTETNVMKRGVLALTHRGTYDFGESNSFIQWENTRNKRLLEGLAGGGEGLINSDEYGTITLENITAKTEWNVHSQLGGVNQTFTFGADYRGEFMHDPVSLQQDLGLEPGEEIPGTDLDPEDRDPNSEAHLVGLYIEDNIMLSDSFTLTPGLRADWHSEAGLNFSPSVNASWQATPEITVKAGVSRAFKAPNLYQLNPNYVYRTRGRGCPVDYPNNGGNGCDILGNPDLEHETSLNKEIGINYTDAQGWNAGLTYFHNDYRNRIAASLEPAAVVGETQIFRWKNTPEAVIEGLEANLRVPLSDMVTWTTNSTVMLKSENKQNGQPLSLVPDYTINTSLDWQVRDDWSITLAATHYGPIQSPTQSVTDGGTIDNPQRRDPYTLVDLSTTYDFMDNASMTAGVKNLFNTQIYREGTANSAGANTYNEPGRVYSLQVSFDF